MRIVFVIIFVFGISVLLADPSIDMAKCELDIENCENESYRQISQNLTNGNNTNRSKSVKSDALRGLDLIENQLVVEQSHIQENGNCTCQIYTFNRFKCSIRIQLFV